MNVGLLTDLARRGVCLRDAEHVARAHDGFGKGCVTSLSFIFVTVPEKDRPDVLVLSTSKGSASPATLATCSVVLNELLYQIAGEVDFTAPTKGQSAVPVNVRPPSNLSDLIAAAVAKATAEPDQK